MKEKLKVLELFAGMRCIGKAFEKAGHEVFSIDWDKNFENIDWCVDIGTITARDILGKFGKPDVVWSSPDCFPEGNMVWTLDGYKDIKDVKCGDYVLTHLGNYKRVYRTIKSNKPKFYSLKVSGVEAFEVTPNHPFYVRKKQTIGTHIKGKAVMFTKMLEPEWIKAENLTNEYRIGIPINNKSEIPTWNGITKSYANSYGITNSWMENTLSQYLSSSDFWWLIGRYIGDGSVSSEKRMIEIACAEDEVIDIKNVIDRIGIKYSMRKKKTSHSFTLSSTELCEFVLQFGRGSVGKRITNKILDLPKELLCAFLEGYISADGHWDYRGKNPCCKISTVSKELAYGLQQCILKAYGLYGSMCTRIPKNTIQNRIVNCHKIYNIGFYKSDSNRRHYVIEDNMAWVNITDVKLLNSKQQSIYNISVEDDESYTINNLATHNCSSYSIAAISHHRTKEADGNLAPKSDYAKFCDTVNIHLLKLISELNPKYWFIENPRGGMRKMNYMRSLPRYTVTYCQYGDSRMKPTDVFTNHPNPNFKPMCKNGDSCHVAAPRGAKTGTQGRQGSIARALIPEELCNHIVKICEDGVSDK